MTGAHRAATLTPPHGWPALVIAPRPPRRELREVAQQLLWSLATGALVAALLVFSEVWS